MRRSLTSFILIVFLASFASTILVVDETEVAVILYLNAERFSRNYDLPMFLSLELVLEARQFQLGKELGNIPALFPQFFEQSGRDWTNVAPVPLIADPDGRPTPSSRFQLRH